MRTAVYPGTFDPVTNGHVDIVKRACQLFDRVLVAIAVNRNKAPLLSLAERVALLQEVFQSIPQVKVVVVEGLLVNFVAEQGAQVIVRGLRTSTDFDYEFQMAGMNRQMHPEIETVFLAPSEEFSFVSSTLVREIIALKGDVSRFVPKAVLRCCQSAAV